MNILSYLGCPSCGSPLVNSETFCTCPDCARSLTCKDNIWCETDHVKVSHGTLKNPYEDIDYTDRASIPFTTTAREEPFFNRCIEDIWKNWGPFKAVMDIGCGDGRFTRKFLSYKDTRVIALDIDRQNLLRTSKRLSQDEFRRVLIVQAAAPHLPICSQKIDAIFSIGLLNTFGQNLPSVLLHLKRFLNPGGFLINSEPTWEGALLYALVRNDPEEFIRVATTKTKTVDIDTTTADRVPVFSINDFPRLLDAAGFSLLSESGIPIWPSLFFGGLLQMKKFSKNQKKELVPLVDALGRDDLPIHRVRFYISRKPINSEK